jgi:predicted amidohydrolase
MENSLKIALAQMSPSSGGISHNLDKAKEFMRKAYMEKANLVIFPEMYLSGYAVIGNYSMKDFQNLAIRTDDSPIIELIQLCSKLDVHLIIGLPLRDSVSNNVIYNAAIFLGPNGVIGVHRKITLPNGSYRGERFCEGKYFNPGDHLSVFKTSMGIFGIFICYELFMPEIPRQLAVQGAEYLICLAAGPASQKKGFDMFLPVRAIENSAYLIFCNLPQEGEKSFFGSSRIIMPNGRILHQAKMGEEDWIIGELDQKEVERARLYYPNLKDRKALEMVTFE